MIVREYLSKLYNYIFEKKDDSLPEINEPFVIIQKQTSNKVDKIGQRFTDIIDISPGSLGLIGSKEKIYYDYSKDKTYYDKSYHPKSQSIRRVDKKNKFKKGKTLNQPQKVFIRQRYTACQKNP